MIADRPMIRIPDFSKLPAPRAGVVVLGPIRHDASGVSYRAWAPGEGEAVALWIDARRVDDDPIRAERLACQAFALGRVRHPNLAEVVRFDDRGGRLAIVERPVVPVETGPDGGPDARPGPSAVRRAVSTVLQASRGVRALHELGLAHGDVRPEALAILDDGRVLLTGLGRVAPPPEDPGAGESGGGLPRPDPSAARADLDGIGRTFYRLVTGTPAGPSADPAAIPPPESLNPRVPAGLSEVIRRLRLPEGEGGYAGIAAAVADLERLAGAPKDGAFLPREELVEAYRSCASEYAEAPTARVRRVVLLASHGGTAALAGLALLVGLRSLALGLVGLMLMTAGITFVVGGIRRGGPLFDRLRRFVAGGRARDLLTVAAVVLLAVAGLLAAGLLGVAVALGIVAAILAGAREALIDRKLEEERREPIARAASLLRDLRHHGLAEPGVLAFAVDHGGERWGPLFLALFGFDAYREAQARRGVPPEERLLRVDLLGRAIAGVDARLRARRDERDRLVLTALEERRLKAEGVYELTARRRAWRIVPALLARARAFESGEPIPGGNLAESLRDAVRDPETALIEAEAEPASARRRALALVDAATGPRVRVLAGLALLVGFLAWAHQNRLIEGAELDELRAMAGSARSVDDLPRLGDALDARRHRLRADADAAAPLRVEGAPSRLSAVFRDANTGVAGLILLVSSLSRARRVGLGAIAAALVALFGSDLGLPGIGPIGPRGTSLAASLAIATLAAIAARRWG